MIGSRQEGADIEQQYRAGYYKGAALLLLNMSDYLNAESDVSVDAR